jgi:hypothetical protein
MRKQCLFKEEIKWTLIRMSKTTSWQDILPGVRRLDTTLAVPVLASWTSGSSWKLTVTRRRNLSLLTILARMLLVMNHSIR